MNDDEDVWGFAQLDEIGYDQQKLGTWDRFYGHAIKEPTTYFSEAGPHTLNAAFSSINEASNEIKSIKQSEGGFVQSDRYLSALFNIGLGRESAFFEHQSEKSSFSIRVERYRLSGHSTVSIGSITSEFIHNGNQMRGLQSFVDHAYALPEPFPAMIAFAGSVSSILAVITEHLTRPARIPHSLLQLQSLFYRPSLILGCLYEVVLKIRDSKNDVNLLSEIYNWSEDLDHVDVSLHPIVLQLLGSTSKPWLEAVGSSIGLQPKNSWSTGLNLKKRSYLEEESLDSIPTSSVMPSFIAEDDATVLVQTSKGLSLLETHSPNNVLITSAISHKFNPPELEWHFGWTDIERIQSKAKLYETRLLQALKSSSGHDSRLKDMAPRHESLSEYQDWPFGIPEDVSLTQVTVSHFNSGNLLHGTQSSSEDNLLHKSVKHALMANATMNEDSSFAPPFSITPLLSFSPIISSQARLINLACFQLIFKQYNLRAHLALQRQYQLFGDGVFVSRLSQALIDPDLSSTQRHKGLIRTGKVGLNLGARESWPPASSELRLALMGILKECFRSGNKDPTVKRLDEELPGGLSFAIRDLSHDEIERCLDPNSIEALDFLRLQYKPPPPLDMIFTVSVLEKYDSIFKLLLRLTRIIFITNQLFRHDKTITSHSKHFDIISRRFRIEARHFVMAVSSYFFESGINSIWNDFELNLDGLEKRLETDEPNSGLSQYNSLDQLQEYHEAVLDQIMSTLLLRKRQEKMMKLLEEVFSLILLFAKEVNSAKEKDLYTREMSGPQDLYVRFNEKVKLFVGSCKDLSSRKDHRSNKEINSGDGRKLFRYTSVRKNGSDSIDQLLLRLDINDYYT